ncbi:39S ribosomal protein L14, mitochondrial [Portunus trituberculatus]|uniref:39S ribosomal protein L14, mitochondrial n=1 Tax=Portunus trituberculatus TaxID=210409 RepID=A0A5B7GZI7_PORTR|nr:39S ribosomal protein L14, mitochondrial [Portunus trituberculatus]
MEALCSADGSRRRQSVTQLQPGRRACGSAVATSDKLWAVQARVGSVARLHTSPPVHEIRKMARLRVVDNSALGKSAMLEGRPPKCIHIYNKKSIGVTGKKIYCISFVMNGSHILLMYRESTSTF